MFRFLSSILFLLVSGVASAASWYTETYPSTPKSSPDAACSYLFNNSPYRSGGYTLVPENDYFRCRFKFSTFPGGPLYDKNDKTYTPAPPACPDGIDPLTGECIAPPAPGGEQCGVSDTTGLPKIINATGDCVEFETADKPSQCAHFAQETRFTTTYVNFDGDGNPIPPPPVIEQGCVATVLDVTNCKAPATRATGTITLGPPAQRCRVAVNFSGEVAEGDSPQFNTSPTVPDVCAPGDDCALPDEPVITESEPCSYYADGEGMVSCSSLDYRGVPGESTDCGSVNGEWQCITAKKPTSTGAKIDTTVQTKANPDGTTTVTKTDVRTDVNCTGVNACQSVTTKTTNVTIKDGNGNTVSSSTDCTGAKCGTGKSGDGDGDGEGTCIVDCDEDEGGEVAGPELDDVPGYGESVENFVSAVEGSPIMTAISGIGVSGSGSCNMGSTSTAIGTISLDYICQNSNWLNDLYYVFLAVWALAAVRVLMSA
ncbi:hypothetical protein ACIGFL_20665 [Pseudomonas sp. NPDC077649]|uniref:hypothetical protein n=1 Tax=Pseudomonas sp. NPDC077649 TaxID=3364423 RepID=UPI0037C9ACE2